MAPRRRAVSPLHQVGGLFPKPAATAVSARDFELFMARQDELIEANEKFALAESALYDQFEVLRKSNMDPNNVNFQAEVLLYNREDVRAFSIFGSHLGNRHGRLAPDLPVNVRDDLLAYANKLGITNFVIHPDP